MRMYPVVAMCLMVSTLAQAMGKKPTLELPPSQAYLIEGVQESNRLNRRVSGRPPFDRDELVTHITLLEEMFFVRFVASGWNEGSIGITMYDARGYQLLSPQKIQQAYRLTYLPTHATLVRVQAGTPMVYGFMNGVATYRIESSIRTSQFSALLKLPLMGEEEVLYRE